MVGGVDGKEECEFCKADWTDEMNSRRCALIDKLLEVGLSEPEQREYDDLQERMLIYRRRVAPLPLFRGMAGFKDLPDDES